MPSLSELAKGRASTTSPPSLSGSSRSSLRSTSSPSSWTSYRLCAVNITRVARQSWMWPRLRLRRILGHMNTITSNMASSTAAFTVMVLSTTMLASTPMGIRQRGRRVWVLYNKIRRGSFPFDVATIIFCIRGVLSVCLHICILAPAYFSHLQDD